MKKPSLTAPLTLVSARASAEATMKTSLSWSERNWSSTLLAPFTLVSAPTLVALTRVRFSLLSTSAASMLLSTTACMRTEAKRERRSSERSCQARSCDWSSRSEATWASLSCSTEASCSIARCD